jgi:hypothetical protein
LQKTFLNNYEKIISNSDFGMTEESLLFDVAPADIHLKYIFLETDTSEVVNTLISSVFDRKILDKKLT